MAVALPGEPVESAEDAALGLAERLRQAQAVADISSRRPASAAA